MSNRVGWRTNHLGHAVTGSIDRSNLRPANVHGTQPDPWKLITGASYKEMQFIKFINDPRLNRRFSQIITLLKNEHDAYYDGHEFVKIYQKNSVQEVRMKGYRYLQHNGLHYKKKI